LGVPPTYNKAVNILLVLCFLHSANAQWVDPARNRKIAVTVIAQGRGSDPYLFFFPPPGAGVSDYRKLLQLLSGYTVVFVQPQYSRTAWENSRRLPVSRQIAFERQEMREWVKDGLFVLSRMKAASVGVFGHGAGGMAAAAACQISPAFRACLDMDGETMGSPFVLDIPFDQPFLWMRPLRVAPPTPTDAELRDRQMTREEYDSIMSKSGLASMWKSRRLATIVTLHAKDAGYDSFTGRGAGTRSFDLARTVIGEFFDEHLKGRKSPLFGGFATGYAEIVYQQFQTTAIRATAH
jgi:pimeloyl-ACP methyl ester carboxylesterase